MGCNFVLDTPVGLEPGKPPEAIIPPLNCRRTPEHSGGAPTGTLPRATLLVGKRSYYTHRGAVVVDYYLRTGTFL